MAGIPITTITGVTAGTIVDNATTYTVVQSAAGTTKKVTIASVRAAINLASEVTGNLPVANLNSGTNASATTFWRGDGTWVEVGGTGAVIGNIYPDPTGVDGSSTWVTSGASITSTTGGTGFDSELRYQSTTAGNAYLAIDVPIQLRSSELEITFEGYLNTGTPTLKFYMQDVTTELVQTSSLTSTAGKFVYSSKFFSSTQSTVIMKFASTAAADVRFTNIYLGRPQNIQGGAISPWTAYTPTFTGFGTVSGVNIRYRRVGENIEIQGSVVVGTPTATEARMTLPTGLNTLSTVPTLSLVGMAGSNNAGDTYLSTVLMEPSLQYLTFGYLNTNPISKKNGNAMITASATLSIDARLPIAEWAGGGTVQLAGIGGNIYLANSQTGVNTNGTVGTSIYSVDGSTIPSHTAVTYYDITLPRSLLPNETIEAQVRSIIDQTWIPVADASGSVIAGLNPSYYDTTNEYGIGIKKITTGQVRVSFGNYACIRTGTNRTWANVNGASDGYDRWRVVVKNPNAAIELTYPTTTAGDLIVYNGIDNVRQAVGTDGKILVVNTNNSTKIGYYDMPGYSAPFYVSTKLYGLGFAVDSTTMTPASNTAYFHPIYVFKRSTWTAIAFGCNTFSANMKVALFDSSNSGQPGAVVANSTVTVTGCVSGTNTATFSSAITLDPGWYYMAMMASTNSGSIVCVSDQSGLQGFWGFNDFGSTAGYSVGVTSTTYTYAGGFSSSNPTLVITDETTQPFLGLKAQ